VAKSECCLLGEAYIYCGASKEVLIVKNLPVNAGDVRDSGLIPGSGISPGKGHGNPLQHCLESPMAEEPDGL